MSSATKEEQEMIDRISEYLINNARKNNMPTITAVNFLSRSPLILIARKAIYEEQKLGNGNKLSGEDMHEFLDKCGVFRERINLKFIGKMDKK